MRWGEGGCRRRREGECCSFAPFAPSGSLRYRRRVKRRLWTLCSAAGRGTCAAVRGAAATIRARGDIYFYFFWREAIKVYLDASKGP